MIITYGKNENGGFEFNLFDQGPATNLMDGNTTFTDAKDLDNAINRYVQARKNKKTKNGSNFPGHAELFLIKNDENKNE